MPDKLTNEEYLDLARRLKDYYAPRESVLRRAEDMYLLHWLSPAQQEAMVAAGNELFVDSAPFDVVNHVVGLVAGAERTVSVIPPKLKGALFQSAETIEKVCEALDYWIDDHSDVPYANALVFSMLVRAAAVTRVLYSNDGDPHLRVEHRDWRYCYPMTEHGRTKVMVEEWDREVKDVLDGWPEAAKWIDDKKELASTVKWTEIWDDERRIYAIDGHVLLDEPHELDSCPYKVVGVRNPLKGADKEALPFIYGMYYPWREHCRLVTLGCESVAQAAGEGAWLVKGKFARPVSNDKGYINVAEDGSDATIAPVQQAQLPAGYPMIIDRVGATIEQTGISRIASGIGGGGVVAGYAIGTTRQANMVRIEPYAQGLEKAYEWTFLRVLSLMKKLGAENVLTGLVAPRETESDVPGVKRRVLQELPDIDSDTIPDRPLVKVSVNLNIAGSEAQDAQIGAMALQAGLPQLTVWDRYFHVKNPLEQQNLALAEKALQQPAVMETMGNALAAAIFDDIAVVKAGLEQVKGEVRRVRGEGGRSPHSPAKRPLSPALPPRAGEGGMRWPG